MSLVEAEECLRQVQRRDRIKDRWTASKAWSLLLLTRIWAPEPPEGATAGPSPREVAQIAIERLDLSAIDIGITPKPGADSVGLVGMPVWLWARQPSSNNVWPGDRLGVGGWDHGDRDRASSPDHLGYG